MNTFIHCRLSLRRTRWGVLVVVLAAGGPPFLTLRAQPVPHHFDRIQALPDRTIMLTLDGSISGMFTNLAPAVSNTIRPMVDLYPVDGSANLRDWTRLSVLVRTNSDLNPPLFHDTSVAASSQRFYRTPTNQLLTGFPAPGGPFAVGTFSRVLTDPLRTNRCGIKSNSSFMSTFWYPSDPDNAGRTPSPWSDPEVAGDKTFYSAWGWSASWATIMSRCVGYAMADMPVAAGTDRFPVIVHSHGYSCDRRFSSQIATELASHGYIVASVDHEDCHATVYPDGRKVLVRPAGSPTPALINSRTNDMQCLLNELAAINAADPILAGRLDLGRVGAMGFSLGGGTAAETCRLDSRVKCAALIDPFVMFQFYNGQLYSNGLQKPFLAVNRTILDHPDNLWDASGDSARLYFLATRDATWLSIANTGHFTFADFAWTVELGKDAAYPARSSRGVPAINACVLWFFDTYLKGEAPAFPNNPEICSLRRK